MLDYRNILFCTDFSEHADDAFEDAAYMASLANARLFVLHVIPGGVGESSLAVPDPLRAAEESDLMDRVERTYGSRTTVKLQLAVRRGHVAPTIIQFAAEINAGLIVIGARGVGRMEGFLIGGSIADKVVRKSKVPVILVSRPKVAGAKARASRKRTK